MDETGLKSCMSDDNFMLYVMSNLTKEYEAVLTNDSGDKLAIKLNHWK